MERNRKRASERSGGQDYWQSYSDMMAALLLMFVLIMALVLLQSLRTFEQKNKDLELQQLTILAQEEELDAQRLILAQQEENLEQVKGELNQVTKMVGVKSDIIAALQEEFKNTNLAVKVDEQTGAITFDTGIFFTVGSAEIRGEGAEFLRSFVPQYLSVLLEGEYKDMIAEIIIEGHTDLTGTYMYNLDLSQRRAYAVSQFCLDETNSVLEADQIQLLRSILTANGRSFSNPIYLKTGEIDAEASRRVVFKFRLKDEEMIAAIQEVLDGAQTVEP